MLQEIFIANLRGGFMRNKIHDDERIMTVKEFNVTNTNKLIQRSFFIIENH